MSARVCPAGTETGADVALQTWNYRVLTRQLSGIRLAMLAATIACLFLTGCSSSTPAAAPRRQPTLSFREQHYQSSPAVRVSTVAARLASDYRASHWDMVRTEFANSVLANRLVNEMRTWSSYGVRRVTVSEVYARQISPGRIIGTLEFRGDAGAIPHFAIYAFGWIRARWRIVGTETGLSGETYETANWVVTHSKHFIVYHSPYQLAGSDRNFLQELERERAAFVREFHRQVPGVATYHLYPDQGTMNRLTRGTCGRKPGNVGCTDPYSNPPSIQASIWPSFHEPIHVYQRAFEPPPGRGDLVYVAPLFIGEGMAVALEDEEANPRLSDYCSSELRYVPLDSCAVQAFSDVNAVSLLSDTGFGRADPGDAYSLGGSFVKYLMLRFGFTAFGKFYYTLAAQPKDRIADYDVASGSVFHFHIQRLLADWKRSLCHSTC